MHLIAFLGPMTAAASVVVHRESPLQPENGDLMQDSKDSNLTTYYVTSSESGVKSEYSEMVVEIQRDHQGERIPATEAVSSFLPAGEIVPAQASILPQSLDLSNFSSIHGYEETIFPPLIQPTTLRSIITTNTSPLPRSTNTGQPEIQSKAAVMRKISFAVYNVSAYMILASMMSILMLAFFD